MAPEAALGERSADHRVDLYSLGCVGYWLLTGQFVFDDKSAARVMQRHITEPPVAPSRRTELPIPPALDAVILACLAKQAADRPATAQQLRERLAAVPVEEPWTTERARRWWDDHLPQQQPCGECDQGTLVPEMSTP
jgi:serine/threonine-protein kinase